MYIALAPSISDKWGRLLLSTNSLGLKTPIRAPLLPALFQVILEEVWRHVRTMGRRELRKPGLPSQGLARVMGHDDLHESINLKAQASRASSP